MRVFRSSNKTSLFEKFNVGKIAFIIIIVQFILNGVFLFLLNSKMDNLIKGSVENFGNLRQQLNQVSVQQYQLQTEVRRMRAQ